MTIYTITDCRVWGDGDTQIGERLSSGAGESSFGLSIFDDDPHDSLRRWHLSVFK
jgi:hypothetical protein